MSDPNVVQSPEMEEIYNLLMAQIEPDLMTEKLSRLSELYPNETPQEWNARQQRYQRALALYEERFTALMKQWEADIVAARNSLVTASKA